MKKWQANLLISLKILPHWMEREATNRMKNAEYDHKICFTSLSLQFLTKNNLMHILVKMMWGFMQLCSLFHAFIMYRIILFNVVMLMLPSCYSSAGTFFSHNNGMEGEVLGSRLTGCVFNLPTKKCYAYL